MKIIAHTGTWVVHNNYSFRCDCLRSLWNVHFLHLNNSFKNTSLALSCQDRNFYIRRWKPSAHSAYPCDSVPRMRAWILALSAPVPLCDEMVELTVVQSDSDICLTRYCLVAPATAVLGKRIRSFYQRCTSSPEEINMLTICHWRQSLVSRTARLINWSVHLAISSIHHRLRHPLDPCRLPMSISGSLTSRQNVVA